MLIKCTEINLKTHKSLLNSCKLKIYSHPKKHIKNASLPFSDSLIDYIRLILITHLCVDERVCKYIILMFASLTFINFELMRDFLITYNENARSIWAVEHDFYSFFILQNI